MSKKPKDRKEKKRRDAKRAKQKAAQSSGAGPTEARRAQYAREVFQNGRALQSASRTEEAVAAYKKALRFDPTLTPALVNLGVLLHSVERIDEAIVFLRRALELEPDFAEAHNNLGTCLQSRGDLEEAARHFARTVALRHEVGPAWVNLGTIKRYTDPNDPDIEAMERELGRLSFNDARAVNFRFALGKVYEDLGQYDLSFEHIDKANRLHRSKVRYDLEGGKALFQKVAREHDTEFLALPPDPTCSDFAPIFIVGHPRSGSTLIEQILHSHSAVHAVGEVPDLDHVVRALCETSDKSDFPEKIRALSPQGIAEIGADYTRRIRARMTPEAGAASLRIADKSLNNFVHVGLIQRALPNAKVIHCRREPIDTCLACYRMHFSSPVNYAYDMNELGVHYEAYQELMVHWHAVMPGRVLDVHYEDVVADQEGQTRRLLEFCGLEWEDDCLAFHRAQRIVSSASVSQVRRPIYSSSVARWKRYEKHVGPMIEALGACAPKNITPPPEQ